MGHKLRLSACVGIALFPNDGDNRSLLIQRADTALSKAKEIGRDNDCFFETTMQEAVERRVVMEKDLRHALEVNQLVLHYQAQVNTTRQLIGVEALVRWQHPERGLISPAEFIPLAEESGLILPLGQWVMEAALLQLRSWQEQGLTPLPRMAINVSSHQFHQPDFVETVQATINRVGVPPEWVELEVTESLMLDNVESAAHKLTRLKKLGVQFAIDDFGTGYSSLAYLKRLPLDRLKIDRSFIHEAHLDTQSAAIVNAILSLAKSLGLEAIAEGVETDGEFEFLRDAGCQYFQGFYLARPQPADQFALKLGGSRARQ